MVAIVTGATVAAVYLPPHASVPVTRVAYPAPVYYGPRRYYRYY